MSTNPQEIIVVITSIVTICEVVSLLDIKGSSFFQVATTVITYHIR